MTKSVQKIKSQRALAQTVKLMRNQGKKVIFTNGCFDILHRGHVTYLEKARSLGDHLVVALNSDESVRRLKGSGRPVNSLEDRLHVIAALGFVDSVTWFEEDTPLELIQKLTPHILVKGADYAVQQIVGAEWVMKHGGKVKTVALVEGKSTTAILKKAKGK